jgi:hypothetical protein
VGSALKTGRRIFYLKVEKVEEGTRGSLKNLFYFFYFAVYKLLLWINALPLLNLF